MSRIVQFDVTKLEDEIVALQRELDNKRSALDFIIKYGKECGVNGDTHKSTIPDSLSEVEKYIVQYITNGVGVKRTDKVLESYARSQRKRSEDVKQEIIEAISSLKEKNIIESEYNNQLKRTTIALKKQKGQ